GPHLSRASKTGLDLVQDEEDAFLPGQGPKVLKELLIRGDDPALALDHLDEDGGGVVMDEFLHAVDIIEVGEDKAWQQRFQSFLVLHLAGGGNGAESPAMERTMETDDLVFVLLLSPEIFPRELQGCLIGLSARITEEYLLGEGNIAEELREVHIGD